MISVSVKNNISFPKLEFPNELLRIANEIIIPDMANRIDRQVQVDGGSYPDLEESTKAIKSGQLQKRIFTKSGKIRETVSKRIEKIGLAGLSSKTLINTGKLRISFLAKKSGKSKVIIYLNSIRADIGKFLQIDGVGKKKKKFLFFGISKNAEDNSIELMKKIISEKINAKQ